MYVTCIFESTDVANVHKNILAHLTEGLDLNEKNGNDQNRILTLLCSKLPVGS